MGNKWMCILTMRISRRYLNKTIAPALLVPLIYYLTGCTVGPNYSSPQIKPPIRWSALPNAKLEVANASNKASHINWWQAFHDPVLNKLIDKAIANNFDLKAATARILQARANSYSASAKFFPEVDGDGVAGRMAPGFITQNIPFGLLQGSFDATWELDFFGGKQRKLESERQFIGSSLEARNDLLISLIAEVAINYLDVRMNQRHLQIIYKNIAAAKTHLNLARSLQKGGVSSELDVVQAKAQYQKFQAAISLKKIALIAAQNRLTTLLAMYSGELKQLLDTKNPKIPSISERILLSMPAEVIRQRPDVRRAELNLAGQTALIGEAIAKLFPDVSIGGFYGKQSSTLLPGTDIWGIVPRVYLPLFQFGRIKSQINLARAREREAYYSYRQVVLNALEDVENHINEYVNIKQREYYLAQSALSFQLALKLSIERYKKGLVDFINITQNEVLLYDAQITEATAATEKSKRFIAVYKSLGVHPEQDHLNNG